MHQILKFLGPLFGDHPAHTVPRYFVFVLLTSPAGRDAALKHLQMKETSNPEVWILHPKLDTLNAEPLEPKHQRTTLGRKLVHELLGSQAS